MRKRYKSVYVEVSFAVIHFGCRRPDSNGIAFSKTRGCFRLSLTMSRFSLHWPPRVEKSIYLLDALDRVKPRTGGFGISVHYTDGYFAVTNRVLDTRRSEYRSLGLADMAPL